MDRDRNSAGKKKPSDLSKGPGMLSSCGESAGLGGHLEPGAFALLSLTPAGLPLDFTLWFYLFPNILERK